MEPILPEMTPGLRELTYELTEKASAFAGNMNPLLRQALGDLVRSMNCYYSNLIEGHDTHLIDIERALRDDYSHEPEKRDLQLEARAHIEVQRLIDLGEMPYPALSEEGIRWLHGEFYEHVPDALKEIEFHGRIVRIEPGEYRRRQVQVGRHIAPPARDLPNLMFRFVDAYSSPMLERGHRIVAVGASHHRLGWIHPFLDGNGRVGRLMSHAYLRELGIGSELWSVSRGLARSVGEYKALLQAADEPRRGDRDGRGSLTQSGLTDFCVFFLETCIDQVEFMAGLLETKELLGRVEVWTKEETLAGRLPKGAWPLLREALVFGEFERGSAPGLTGYKDRQARTVLSDLLEKGLLTSESSRDKVRIAFPSSVVERWFPGLYRPASSVL
ncbi:Fic family protein [Azorhizobium sp. AG788]|uniref:Fic family protein n=1 Tax=Azorhizobium sp. AG788 TaxID=2183897 RepID=UPI001060F1BB|nr:Fic family protein [Azorhizobium sp. AG788]